LIGLFVIFSLQEIINATIKNANNIFILFLIIFMNFKCGAE